MSNLLCIYETEEPTNQETRRFLDILCDFAQLNVRSKRCMDLERDDLQWCDIIYAIRASSSFEASLSKWAKKNGKLWLSLYDDDFLSLDSSYGSSGQGYRNNRKECIKKVLNKTNILVASNKLLADKYSEIGNISRSYISDTVIDCSRMTIPPKSNGKEKIVLYVNDASKDMFEQIIRPAFPILAERMSDKIAFYFMALRPELKEYEDKFEINYVPHMPFDEFLDYIGKQGFSIGLAPLVNEGFSRYKYFNKFIEYTRAGITGIYSDCDLYRQVITDKSNGLLCKNTPSDWFNAINYLVNNPEERIKMALRAQQYARDNLNKETIAQRFINDIPELGTYKAPSQGISLIALHSIRVRYRLFRALGWIQTAITMIKNGNVKGIFPKIKQMVKRG